MIEETESVAKSYVPRKLYHRDIFMPERFTRYVKLHESQITKVMFSRHLMEYFDCGEEKHDITREGILSVLKRCVLNPVEPFEVEAAGRWVKKYVIRTSYNDTKDISIAIICKDFKSGLPFDKTAWLNNKDDIHGTLDIDKYTW